MYSAQEIKEHRLIWIETLESGEYEQGRGALRHGGAESPLPSNVAEWLDISSSGGIRSKNEEVSLAELNDSGKSFSDIARLLRLEGDCK